MAGWKLRKDKTLAEEPGADVEATVGALPLEAEVPAQWETAGTTEQEHTGGVLEIGHAGAQTYGEQTPIAPEPDFETGNGLHFEDEDNAPIIASAPIIAAPPPAETEAAEPAAKEFSSTLRMNREELATAFTPSPPAGIPAVAPFVLDAPLVSPPTPENLPRLVVRVGRLAGAFDLTQDVTVIGRPDSKIENYPDVEIDMDDAVSRRHAEVVKRDDGFYLRDAGSTNGTLLNGEKLLPHDERLLTHGDRIRVGERTEIVFE
jgi:hypothetical protein